LASYLGHLSEEYLPTLMAMASFYVVDSGCLLAHEPGIFVEELVEGSYEVGWKRVSAVGL
jgi:hypothetical protein